MKLAILLVSVFIAVSLGDALDGGVQAYQPKKLGVQAVDLISEDNLDELLEALKNLIENGDVCGLVDKELNPLTDDLLTNLGAYITRSGMDPVELEDQTLQLLGILGSIKLTKGWLQGLSTIDRTDDVIVSYNSATKKVTFKLPLSFKVLLFTYQYKTRVTLVTINGDVQGKIDNVKMNVLITYNPTTKGFVLDDLDMADSGKVTVKFSGNGLVDWITNAMTEVMVTVLHPLLMAIVAANVKSVGNEIVDSVNDYINKNLNATMM